MRKYRRKLPLFSPLKLGLAALCAAAASALNAALPIADNPFTIIFGGLSAALFIVTLFTRLGASGRYRYFDEYIELSYLFFIKRKLDYSRYYAIVISNASYNSKNVGYSMPMQYKVAGRTGCSKITFPYITLLGSQYPLSKITVGMYNYDLCVLNDDLYCLGICWFDSFEELLHHMSGDVYILEDVYSTYRGQFDRLIALHGGEECRFRIIRNRGSRNR